MASYELYWPQLESCKGQYLETYLYRTSYAISKVRYKFSNQQYKIRYSLLRGLSFLAAKLIKCNLLNNVQNSNKTRF